MTGAIDISSSGMIAQRTRMNVISNNIANADTAHNVDGERVPYRRREVEFSPVEKATVGTSGASNDSLGGVKVADIRKDQSDFRKVYKPGHPAANEKGYVKMPNVNRIVEMVDMISASRAYEANVTALQNAKSMHDSSLRILA